MHEVSIIIVNYNTPELLENCIASIYKYEQEATYEIIVVDNDSDIRNCESICSAYPAVRWIQLDYNSGFSRANNIGLHAAKGKFVLLLNSDTIFIEPILLRCLEYFSNHPGTGILGCRLLNVDGSTQKSYYWHPDLTKLWSQNALNIYFTRMFKDKCDKISHQKNHKLELSTHETEWLCGAFIMAESRVIREKNIFLDEDFFMYSEDVVWCSSFRKTGYKIIYFSEASLIHYGGNSSNSNEKRNAQITISSWMAIRKIHGSIYFFVYSQLLMINSLLDHLLYLKQKLMKQLDSDDICSLKQRKFQMKLLKKYGFYILLKFGKQPSKSKEFLKYDF